VTNATLRPCKFSEDAPNRVEIEALRIHVRLCVFVYSSPNSVILRSRRTPRSPPRAPPSQGILPTNLDLKGHGFQPCRRTTKEAGFSPEGPGKPLEKNCHPERSEGSAVSPVEENHASSGALLQRPGFLRFSEYWVVRCLFPHLVAPNRQWSGNLIAGDKRCQSLGNRSS